MILAAPSPLGITQGLPPQNRHPSGFKVCCCWPWQQLAKLAPGRATFVWFVDLLYWFFKILCAWGLVRKEESSIVSDRRALQCPGVVFWWRNWNDTNFSESQAGSQGGGTKPYLAEAQASTLHLKLMGRNLQADNIWPSVWFAKEGFPTFLC